MEITLREMIAARDPLQKLAGLKLPAASAYRIARLISRLNPELASAEIGRLSLYREYGTEKDGSVTVPLDRMDAFQPKLDAYLDTSTEIDVQPLAFSDIEQAEITPGDILSLGQFIQEPK